MLLYNNNAIILIYLLPFLIVGDVMDLLHYLRTFVCLAENKTMAKATDILQYAQPTISTHIANLESYYGCPLIDFQNRKYVLTEEGTCLYNYAVKILAIVTEAHTAIEEFRSLERGTLMIGSSSNIGVYMLPKILGLFREHYPDISLRVFIDRTQAIEKKVVDYELNIGIVEADVYNTNLKVEFFRKEPLVLIVSPLHPWAKREGIKADELLTMPFVVGEQGSGTRRFLERQIGDIINHVNISLELGSTEAVKKAVENSLGISIVVESAITRELQSGTLVSVPITGVEIYKEYKIIYPSNKYLTEGTKRFLSILRSFSL